MIKYLERLKILQKKLLEVLVKQDIPTTDAEAANFLGTSSSTFGRWRKGEIYPDAEHLIIIAEKLNISPNWLLLGKGHWLLDEEGEVLSKSDLTQECLLQRVADLEEMLADKRELLVNKREQITELKNRLALCVEHPFTDVTAPAVPIINDAKE